MARNYPQTAQKWRPDLRTFPAIFFDWKGGSANFFALRMYAINTQTENEEAQACAKQSEENDSLEQQLKDAQYTLTESENK